MRFTVAKVFFWARSNRLQAALVFHCSDAVFAGCFGFV
jgi:hypothetical protein